MKLVNFAPMYDFSARGLRNSSGFKRHVDHAVREIQEVVGSESGIYVHIEPEVKGMFTLSISTDLLGKPITVKRTGKRIYTLLRQVKKTLIRIFRRSSLRRSRMKRIIHWERVERHNTEFDELAS